MKIQLLKDPANILFAGVAKKYQKAIKTFLVSSRESDTEASVTETLHKMQEELQVSQRKQQAAAVLPAACPHRDNSCTVFHGLSSCASVC